jgi:CheY-like chemotaxis protein
MASILFVEDTPGCQQAISIALRGAGHAVTVVGDGAEALQYLRQCRPDLILLDMVMPEIDGLELLRQIRAEERWKTIPVIVFTASTNAAGRLKAEAFGIQAYLIKAQVSIVELRAVVAKYATGTTSVTLENDLVNIAGCGG